MRSIGNPRLGVNAENGLANCNETFTFSVCRVAAGDETRDIHKLGID